jgi:hypothetical protein
MRHLDLAKARLCAAVLMVFGALSCRETQGRADEPALPQIVQTAVWEGLQSSLLNLIRGKIRIR